MFAKVVLAAVSLTALAQAGGVYPAAPVYAAPPPRLLAAPVVAKAVVAAPPDVSPQSYSFGYNSADEFGTRIQRQETSDVNNVRTGSYGYADANGIFRHVQYIADAAGFRASVDTNEPGTAGGQTAGVLYNAAPVPSAPAPARAPVVAVAAPYKVPFAVAPAAVTGVLPAPYPTYAKPAAAAAPLYAAPPKYAAPAAVGYAPKYL
uniref:Putative cuticle protein n=1 Tax=Ixodes ricinus TaxID=34613 RepID=A0A0K8RH49_IXORI